MVKNVATVIMYVLVLFMALLRAATGHYDMLLFFLGLGAVVFVIAWIVALFEPKQAKTTSVASTKTAENNQRRQEEEIYYEDESRCPTCSGNGRYIACKNCGGTPTMFDDHDDGVDLVCLFCRKEGLDDENIDYVTCEDCHGSGKFDY